MVSEALELLPTTPSVVILSNVKAIELFRERVVFSDTAFADLVLWLVPQQDIARWNHENRDS